MEILILIFFYELLEVEIVMRQSQNLGVAPVKILDHDAQYFWRYDMWKLGFFQAPELHHQEVTLGKFP